MKTYFLSLVLALPASGAINNLNFGPLSNAATMTFVTDSQTACTFDVVRKRDGVSVPFLSSTYFPGANVIAAGTAVRRVMIGGVGLKVSGVDHKIYPTTLEPMTDYLVPLTCGTSSTTGQFSTGNRPLGLTWSPRTLPNPASPGGWLEPTIDHTVSGHYSLNNPMTGFAEHRISKPRQMDGDAQSFVAGVPAATADWNTGTMSGIQSNSDGGVSAIYSGTSQAKLFIPIRVDMANAVTLDSIEVGLNVCSDIGAGFNVALTYDGVTPSSVVRTGTTSAPASATTCTAGGSTLTPAINTAYDDWDNGSGFEGPIDINPNSTDGYMAAITACADVAGLGKRIRCTHDGTHNFGTAPGTGALLITGAQGNTIINGFQRIQIVDSTHFDILGILSNGTQTGSATGSSVNPNFGILVWATSNAQQKLLIDYVTLNAYFDNRATAYYSGAADYCSKLKDLAGAYKCVVLDGGYAKLYAFWTEDTPAMPPYSSSPHNAGDSAYLGDLYHVTGLNTNGTSWSNNDPDTLYGGLDIYFPNTLNAFTYSSTDHQRCGSGNNEHYAYDQEVTPVIGQYHAGAQLCRFELLTNAGDSFRAWNDANRPDGHKFSPYWGSGMSVSGVIGTLGGPDYVALTVGAQDALTVYAVYDVANAVFKGSMYSYLSDSCRWCTQHASEPNPGSFSYSMSAKYARGDNVNTGWPYSWRLAAPIPAPSGPTQQITVTSICDGSGVTPRNAQPCNEMLGTGSSLAYLMDAKPGDVMRIGNQDGTVPEYAQIVSVDSYNSTTNIRTITVRRPFWTMVSPSQSTGQAWAANTFVGMTSSNVTDTNASAVGDLPLRRAIWDFRSDPWGLHMKYEAFFSDSHEYRRGSFANGGDGLVDCGTDTNEPDDCADQPTTYYPVKYSTFQGRIGLSNGNTIESHPSHAHAIQARTPLLRRSYVNLHPFIAAGWNDNPVTNVLQAGTRSVYQVTGFGQDFDGNYRNLDPTLTLPFVWAGGGSLRDISGPGSVIDDTKPFTYCWVRIAGECRSGSSAGNVYVAVPVVVVPSCSDHALLGFCIGQSAMQHAYVIQQAIVPNREGLWGASALNANQTSGLALGPGWARIVTDQGYTPGAIGPADGAIGTPDGNWVFHRMQSGRVDWFATHVPALPAKDIIQRDQFVPIEVKLTPPSALGVNNAVVEFGYDNRLYCQGMDANGTWNGRSDICVAGAQNYATVMFASETVTGVPCSSGCTVTVPAIAQRLLHYRWKYRDASNQVLSTSEILSMPVN